MNSPKIRGVAHYFYHYVRTLLQPYGRCQQENKSDKGQLLSTPLSLIFKTLLFYYYQPVGQCERESDTCVFVYAWAGRLRSAVEWALLSVSLGSGDHTQAVEFVCSLPVSPFPVRELISLKHQVPFGCYYFRETQIRKARDYFLFSTQRITIYFQTKAVPSARTTANREQLLKHKRKPWERQKTADFCLFLGRGCLSWLAFCF